MPTSVASTLQKTSILCSSQIRPFDRVTLYHPTTNSMQDSCNWAPIATIKSPSSSCLVLLVYIKLGHGQDPHRVVQEGSPHILTPPLTHIVNVSISPSQFPSCWKQRHKPHAKTYPPSREDLRPIFMLSVLSKVFEKAILDSGISDRLKGVFQQNSVWKRSPFFNHRCSYTCMPP